MNGWTRIFLVLLRLAMGWLFLFAGIEKVESRWDGKGKPFSSEGYFREASGPMAPIVKAEIGDPDEETLALVTARPPGANNDFSQRVPERLSNEWDAYYRSFTEHYGLTEAQKKDVQAVYDAEKKRLGEWLVGGVKEVERPLGGNLVKFKLTTPARIEEFQKKIKEVDEAVNKELPAFEKDVRKEKLTAQKAEVRKLRSELLADVKDQTQKMQDALAAKLTAEQKAKGPTETVVVQTPAQSRLAWADFLVPYVLLGIGACLLLGLFSRLACVAGAVFLLTLYMAMPPWPGLPDAPRAEDHYYYVSKNLIILFALLTLATTRSGAWFGLDGLLRALFGGRRRESVNEARTVQERRLAQRVHS